MPAGLKPKWLYKSCPRCGGDVYIVREDRAPEAPLVAHCLQCGFEKELTQQGAPEVARRSGTQAA
jgi:uncharacterized Zn finger protein